MSYHILIVDDSEADQFLCEYAMQEYDASIKVSKAADGREALSGLKEKHGAFDFIFLDINMPGMNGFEFLDALNQSGYKPRNIIVMLTSSIRDDDHQRCVAYPMVKMVVSKPINRQLLIDCISA